MPQKYLSKPRAVEAEQVTAENMARLAKWCDGDVCIQSDQPEVTTFLPRGESPTPEQAARAFIKVKAFRPQNRRQTEAHVGDWLILQGKNFKVYMDAAFKYGFDEAPSLPGLPYASEVSSERTPIHDQLVQEIMNGKVGQLSATATAMRIEQMLQGNGIDLRVLPKRVPGQELQRLGSPPAEELLDIQS